MNRRGATTVALALGLAATLTACGGDSSAHGKEKDKGGRAELSVDGGYLPRPVMADMAVAYVKVRNSGSVADRLTSVTTPLSAEVTLHTTEGTRMRQVTSLAIPAGGALKLTSGGNHLMLGTLTHLPKVGERVPFTLRFADSPPLTVTIPVEPTTYRSKD